MIENATEDDIPEIRNLMHSQTGFWQDSWRPEVLDIAIKAANGLAFVWKEDGQILGFVCAHDLGFRAYLSELIIHSKVRRHGLAKKLVEHVQEVLQERGCNILIADVWKDAEEFYRSLGWSEPDVVLLRKKIGE
jgi:ribosomal protein S18 acetylase RimI-like enzyme